MRTVLVLVLLAGFAAVPAALSPPVAAGAGLAPAVADCNANAQLTRHYTISELRAALNSIPADVGEYSNCHDLIQHQLLLQLAALRRDGGSGGGGGSFLPTWLIVVLAVLVAAGGGFGVLALRARGEPSS